LIRLSEYSALSLIGLSGWEQAEVLGALEVLQWLADRQALADATLTNPQEAKIALLRTLSAGHVRRGMEDSHALPSEQVILGFEGMLGCLRTFRDGERWKFESHPTDDEYSLANDYTNALGQVCQHRRLFATQSGRMGIGPPSVREGDPICLFRGYDRLFILKSEPTDGSLKVVGETDVHGIMRSKLFGESGELHEKLPTQVFTLS
jgi:hypothetical protein